MMDFISQLASDCKEASERPEIKGGNIDYLLKAAAMHLENQQAEIGSLKAQMRDMSWDLENSRITYIERDRSNEW